MGFWTALGTPNGLPVTSAPIGLSDGGLPIGMQIIGPRLEDYTTIAFADLLERQLGYGFSAPSGSLV
jgi:amidase